MSVLEQATYDLALRALSQQEQTLAELRARTGTLLTAASLIASFLGSQAIARAGFEDWTVLALLAFGLSVALSIYVLLPKEGLIFVVDASRAYEALREVRLDGEEVQRRMVYGIQALHERNEPLAQRMNRAFEIAGVALLLEIALLVVAIVVG